MRLTVCAMAPSARPDERSPLLADRAPAAADDEPEDPTKLPTRKRNAILVAVWLGVFVRSPLQLIAPRRADLATGLQLGALDGTIVRSLALLSRA